MADPFNRHQPLVGSAASPTGSPGNSAAPSSLPSSVPSARPATTTDANLTDFVCRSTTIEQAGQKVTYISGVRTGAHTGYDRLTVALNNGQVGRIEISPQSGTNFVRSPIGDTVELAGQAGIRIVIFSTDAHTAYSGPMDIVTGYTGLVEVRMLEDFEGYVQLALGVSRPGCYRAALLTNPARLAIDIQAS